MSVIGDVVQWLIGEKGQVALAGAAGGMVRWLTVKSRWTDGVISIIVGSLSAIYLGPLAEPAIDALLGQVIVDEISRGAFSGFMLGLGGISATGWVIDWWSFKRRKAAEEQDNDDHDGEEGDH